MSDAGAIGFAMVDFADLLSERYYRENNPHVKSHIGFGLIMLKDLIELIEVKEHIDMDALDDLNNLQFFKNEEEAKKFIQKELRKD